MAEDGVPLNPDSQLTEMLKSGCVKDQMNYIPKKKSFDKGFQKKILWLKRASAGSCGTAAFNSTKITGIRTAPLAV